METPRIQWKVDKQGSHLSVTFDGEVNEAVAFEECLEQLTAHTGTLNLDLAGIRRLNSAGVREWVKFMRSLSETEQIEEITYTRCSLAIVAQINMIKGFQGRAKIVSVYAPYSNEETGEEDQRLLEVADIKDPMNPPTFDDPEGGVWELDEMPERYFSFLLLRAPS